MVSGERQDSDARGGRVKRQPGRWALEGGEGKGAVRGREKKEWSNAKVGKDELGKKEKQNKEQNKQHQSFRGGGRTERKAGRMVTLREKGKRIRKGGRGERVTACRDRKRPVR